MFTAIISTLLTWFSEIFWKKSLWYWVWSKMHDLLSYPVWLIIGIYFVYLWIDYSNIDPIIVIWTILVFLLCIIKSPIAQKIYREEKISVIMPYSNLNKILSIIFSFFLFADVSIIALILTIIAIFVVILFSIDFKTLRLPKNLKIIALSEFLTSIITISSWYLILKYSEILYFIIFVIFWITFLILITYFTWQYKSIKWLKKDFWFYRYVWSTWWISRFLSLVVIKNLWLSVTILLSFLWIWITLLLSLIILKDKPSKKDLLLTIIVTALVWLWFFFK